MKTLASFLFETFENRRFTVGRTAAVLLLLLVGVSGQAIATRLPLQSNGTLGVFRPTADTLFDTDAGTFRIGNNLTAGGRRVTLYVGGAPVDGTVFDFASIEIPPGVTVRARGRGPLILLARATVNIEGRIDVSGQSGG